jgi:ribosomal protein L37AE/L43A
MTYRHDDEDVYGFNRARVFKDNKSALRAASHSNPRNLPCPTCKEPNKLTPKDKARGYQCDACADRAEGGGY